MANTVGLLSAPSPSVPGFSCLVWPGYPFSALCLWSPCSPALLAVSCPLCSPNLTLRPLECGHISCCDLAEWARAAHWAWICVSVPCVLILASLPDSLSHPLLPGFLQCLLVHISSQSCLSKSKPLKEEIFVWHMVGT